MVTKCILQHSLHSLSNVHELNTYLARSLQNPHVMNLTHALIFLRIVDNVKYSLCRLKTMGSIPYTSMSSPQHLWCRDAMKNAFQWNGLMPFFRATAYPPLPNPEFWLYNCGFVPKAGLQLWSYEKIYEAHVCPDERPHVCCGKGKEKCGRFVTCFAVECKAFSGPLTMCAHCLKSMARRGQLVRPDPATVLSVPYYVDKTKAAG